MPTTLYITRHGETEWNVLGKLQGHADSPLTELGIQQASLLGARLLDTSLAAIYASSSGRAQRTAQLIRGDRPLPLSSHDALREVGQGRWEGLTRDQIAECYPDEFARFWNFNSRGDHDAPEGAETVTQVRARLLPLIEQLLTQHADETVLIVTHAGTTRRLMQYFFARAGSPQELQHIQPTSLSKVVIDGEQVLVELFNDTAHYDLVLEQ